MNLKAQPGDPNAATWLNDSLNSQYTPGLWGIFTVDVERGLLFVPVEKVGNDYYGGPHHGNNLYSDSLLAVDANTGKIKWYQQLVHHDIWDYDLAAQPTLVEARRNGRVIPGVAQITKMGILFVFNRETGEPMYGMEERPVPQTTAQGEWTSPTQPFPLKPAPLARNSLKKSELAKVTPELEASLQGSVGEIQPVGRGALRPLAREAGHRRVPWRDRRRELAGRDVQPSARPDDHQRHERRAVGPSRRGDGPAVAGGGAVRRPAEAAAASRPAARARARRRRPRVRRAPSMNKVTPEGGRFWDAEHRYSCAAPPWGELVAVNANTGDIAWRVPLGEFPELAAKGIKTGQPMLGGGITTAGNLVFIGATIDGYFRAFDARNGNELWRDKLDAPAHSIPSTYMGRDGKQYVVVPAGGGGFLRSPTADTLIAFALPR